jgi:hypothetical protein
MAAGLPRDLMRKAANKLAAASKLKNIYWREAECFGFTRLAPSTAAAVA